MSQKQKIVFYYPDMFIGGVEMAIINLAKRLYQEYDLYFFYRSIANLQLAKELTFYGIPMNINAVPSKFHFECDTLVYCSLWMERDNFIRTIRARQKVLWSHAMVPPLCNTKFYVPSFVRTLDKIVSVSIAADQTIPKYMYSNKINNKCCVINNILNADEIKEKAREPIPELPLAKDLNIVTVARLSAEKGWKRIKVFADLLNQKQIEWKWFVVGEGYRAEELDKIHELLDPYPQIVFLGKKLNPFPIVKQMDYAALLSDFESWGLAITEAKILGVPPIVTNFPAAKEQVEHDCNGILIPLKSYGYYNQAIDLMLSNKEKYKKQLASFDYEEQNKKIVKQWKEILG